MKTMDKVCCLVAALSVQTAAADYSDMFFFGDSLSDSGTYLPFLLSTNPNYTGEGKFTTSPGNVWAENIAERYGFNASPVNQGGNNYAQGGARIQGEGYSFTTAMSLVDQVDTYLGSVNGQADHNALYSLWAGGNDFLWMLEGNVAAADVPAYLGGMVANNMGAITRLEGAGAQYILLPSIPDITNTPTASSLSAEQIAQISTLTKSYNQQLFIQAAASGVTVIPMDIDRLFTELQANPTQYGLLNTTTALCPTVESALFCIEGETYTAGDEWLYAFADFAHPTVAGHQLISDYVYSMLNGSALANAANQLTINESATVQQNLHTMLRNTHIAESTDNLWIDANISSSDPYDKVPLRFSAGILIPTNETSATGFAIHLNEANLENSSGDVDYQSVGLSLFHHREYDQLHINTSMMVTAGKTDLDRQVDLLSATRTMHSDADSLSFNIQGELNYYTSYKALEHGPILGARYQYVSFDSLKEKSSDGTTSTSLMIDDHSQQSTLLYAGWHFAAINDINSNFSPYLDITWHYRTNEDDDSLLLALVDYENNRFSTPTQKTDKSYGLIETGASWKLSDKVALQGRLSYRSGDSQQENVSAGLSALISF